MQKIAPHLREMISEIDAIVSSPYVRAQQTAVYLREVYPAAQYFEAAELVPHAPAITFVRWLKAHALDFKSVMLVGHEPHLSLLASYLLAGNSQAFLDIKKAGFLTLEIEDSENFGPQCAKLSYLIPPRAWID